MKLNKTLLKRIVDSTPNGLWVWHRSRLRTDYLDALVARKCSRVYMKVFDDVSQPHFWSDECSRDVVKQFNDRGISVVGWGYHFDQRTSVDVDLSVREIQKAMDCGLDGYIFDLEKEVKDHASHGDLESLLKKVRAVTGDKFVGYTSFGYPEFHKEIPWKMLDELCDIAFPQIYFELWGFDSDQKEVERALRSHEELGLSNPILPIWSSEPGAPKPASASSLQHYLQTYPGSSIWLAPHRGQICEAWNLDYDGTSPVFSAAIEATTSDLGKYTDSLSLGAKGIRVKRLQMKLEGGGYPVKEIDGIFGPRTQQAVKRFQLVMGLSSDGIVGPRTWAALGGEIPQAITAVPDTAFTSDLQERLATFAETEAAHGYVWLGAESEAEKYLRPMREPMRRLGHIGAGPVFFNWCAAFVTYCARSVGIKIPDQPDGFWATMALVESWKYWAKQNGTWLSPAQTKLRRGDIICFEWSDGDASLDHIGIVRDELGGGNILETAEGNRGNRTVNGTRPVGSVAGIIRLH